MKAFIRPRPIRVAFLVDEHEHWKPMLEAIFANCYGRWGGRFNLIVPCENGEIRPAYLPWLTAYDPDVIYCYVDLSDTIIQQLHERLYPSYFSRHNFYNTDQRESYAFRPQFSLGPLSSLSVALLASRATALSGPRPVTLVDVHSRNPAPPLIQENFGCYSQSLNQYPVPPYLAEYIQAFTLTDQEIIDNPHLVPRPQGEFVSDYRSFLSQLASRRDVSGLALLSASMCPRIQMNDPRWTNRINLIVGDSFIDRITFWNARSYLDAYLDPTFVTLKLAQGDIDDDYIFASVIAFIRNRMHVTYSSNMSRVTIRSASHSVQQVEQFVERFRRADQFNSYSSEPIDSIDQCCPAASVLETAMDHVEERGVFRVSDWQETTFSEASFRPPMAFPHHIRDGPSTPSGIARGAWALDLDIERATDYSRFENVRHRWRLPRRLRMTTAFSRTYQLGGMAGPLCVPRVTKHGLISLFGGMDGQLPELTLPTDESAFRYALCVPRNWQPFAPGRGPHQNSLFYAIRPSDKGRYFTALMHLSGDIHDSREIFLKRFWSHQLEFLGASPSAGESRLPDLIRRLQSRLRSGQLIVQEDWERVARVVLTEAREVRLAPRYLRFNRLAEQFEEFRNAYWATHPAGAPREEWDEHERKSLEDSVQYLCQREILHQGHEWLCPRCNNSNWVSVNSLRKMMECEVCGTTQPAPVSTPWHFKLNSFVLEGLRDHGLLANLWCLSRLSDQAEASFFFLGPHELFFTTDSTYRARPDAEIDLVVVVDGVVHLCDVKTSNQNIDLQRFAELARQIRPDVATLAIMEPRSARIDRRLDELRRSLDGTAIHAELITLEEQDIDDSPHLPTGRSRTIRLI
jgi:hypothetical protein